MSTELVSTANRAKQFVQPTPSVTLASICQKWTEEDDENGQRFTEAMASFLHSQPSQHTRRSYSYAIRHFWDWLCSRTGRCPMPNEVSRVESTAYARWLEQSSDESTELQLARQGSPLRVALYHAVANRPGSHIDDVRMELVHHGFEFDADDESIQKIERELGTLVRQRYLTREPTIEQLREERNDLCIERPDPATFVYKVRSKGKPASSTVHARLSALSSFWRYLAEETGENVSGAEGALLRHNLWLGHVRRAGRKSASRKKASRAVRTPSLELFVRLLATTYRKSHEDQEERLKAAREAVEHGRIVSGEGQATVYDLRDRALLLLLLLTGLRASEVRDVRRQDLDDSGLLTVVGKGGKTRVVSVPGPARTALEEFRRRLVALAETARQRGRYAPRTARLDDPLAPLLPPLKQWGANRRRGGDTDPSQMPGMGQAAITTMLRRRARAAGVEKGSREWKQLGVHGIRHLAGKYAISRGVPLPVVQAVLGHSNLSTTGLYVEEREPSKITLWPDGSDGEPSST